MSDFVEPADNIGEAWLRTLELVHLEGGRRTNVLTTVAEPLSAEPAAIRAAIDKALVPGKRRGTSVQRAETVANTIFPHDLYRDTGLVWSPDLDVGQSEVLDTAANDLYEAYSEMLGLLRTANGNPRGTYFGRMISWPGKEAGGVNQLAARVKYLRSQRRKGNRSYNLSDIAIGGEAELSAIKRLELDDVGVQVYAADDTRQRGFPCLVHIDLTLLDGRLSMVAVYRHQYLITKAYGNMLGLARLLAFLAQQTGFEVGELAVLATLADSEETFAGGKRGVAALIASARSEGAA
ncbi:hypothetical protein [Amycolatopsis sp. NBC_01480]|uniref:hypothetical protein n=1 Tax=Amycolatopsis sp. NBC_01480 TaxID=2903562 RepID=UPI002E283887|nr:hypothetical protein [Amycolatopsis sp. NBC_01480]